MTDMNNGRLDELEARFNEELDKDAEEIDVEKVKQLLDRLGEKPLSDVQKHNLARIYTELKDKLFNE